MKKTKLIQSLDRGLQILDMMQTNPHKKFTVKEVGEFLDIDTSSAFRLLNTLEQRAYVSRTPDNNFYLGSTIYSLYGALAKQLNLPSFMHKYLEEITSKTGETSHLAVCSKDRAVFIDRVVGTEVISVNTDIGQSEPLYCTSVGKALMCKMTSSQIEKLLGKKFKGFTPTTYTSSTELIKNLQKVKNEGLAFDMEEYQQGVMCAAAPIYDCSRQVVCALGLSGPADRISKNLETISSLIQETGRKASIALGYIPE
ncbi:MAG: IclR family transcriptional regulator [Victivallales bacterium]|nr:IclR family transcriptional regulator [Victivallales bacterium]